MNTNTQHRSDAIIERELEGLRQPVESTYGIGDAVRTMQAKPTRKRSFRKWPIGIGSVAIVGGAIVMIGSLTPSRALADELQDIAFAQKHQALKYMKAYIYGGEKKPVMIHETWTDHGKEAYRQYRGDANGKVDYAIVRDGNRNYHFFVGNEQMAQVAMVDEDRSDHFTIETIDTLLNSPFFKKHKIEKTSGVKLNGRTCDYYSFANGYYRVWVDPATRLPLQREIYDRGVTLWERDVYQYPTSFAAGTFTPYLSDKVTYFDYIAARNSLLERLEQPGQSQKVGNITITLKAVIKDELQVRAIWSTTGVDGANTGSELLQISGAHKAGWSTDLSTKSVAPTQELLNAGLAFAKPFALPATVRIAAWEPGGGKGGAKLVGWATFNVDDVLTTPQNGQLLRTQSGEVQKAATAVTAKN